VKVITGAIRRENVNVGARESGKGIRCYACGNFGHVVKACTASDVYGIKRIGSGNGSRARDRRHLSPRQ
jgi:hypothetical protein